MGKDVHRFRKKTFLFNRDLLVTGKAPNVGGKRDCGGQIVHTKVGLSCMAFKAELRTQTPRTNTSVPLPEEYCFQRLPPVKIHAQKKNRKMFWALFYCWRVSLADIEHCRVGTCDWLLDSKRFRPLRHGSMWFVEGLMPEESHLLTSGISFK